jgi:hypothetical protein
MKVSPDARRKEREHQHLHDTRDHGGRGAEHPRRDGRDIAVRLAGSRRCRGRRCPRGPSGRIPRRSRGLPGGTVLQLLHGGGHRLDGPSEVAQAHLRLGEGVGGLGHPGANRPGQASDAQGGEPEEDHQDDRAADGRGETGPLELPDQRPEQPGEQDRERHGHEQPLRSVERRDHRQGGQNDDAGGARVAWLSRH